MDAPSTVVTRCHALFNQLLYSQPPRRFYQEIVQPPSEYPITCHWPIMPVYFFMDFLEQNNIEEHYPKPNYTFGENWHARLHRLVQLLKAHQQSLRDLYQQYEQLCNQRGSSEQY